MNEQLSFLDILEKPKPAPTPAEIIAFPAERMCGRLRDTAAFILQRPEAKQEWHFRNQVHRVWHQLKVHRLSDDEAGAQMRAFAAALEVEMRRQQVITYLYGDVDEVGGSA
jgi:hypothetical protein